MSLAEKQIVIFGGSLGIGLAAARIAAESGAKVTIVGRSREKLLAAQKELHNVEIAVADAADESAVKGVFERLETVDHVYNAAGSFVGGTVLENSAEFYRAAFEARIWGSFHIVRAAFPKMQPNGSFVFTGGVSTARPVPGAWATAVATAAAEQMARALAVEIAPVRVNAVAPGWTDTPMWDEIFGENKREVFAGVAEKLLTKRLATAEEVAQAVIFLMNNDSITGETIHVEGGHRLV